MGINEDGEMVYDGLVSTFVMGEGGKSLTLLIMLQPLHPFPTLCQIMDSHFH